MRKLFPICMGFPLLLGSVCIPEGAVKVEPGAVEVNPRILTDETTIKGAVGEALNQKGILTVVADAKKEQNANFEKVQKAIVNNGMPSWVWALGIVGVLFLIYLVILQFKQLAIMQDQCRYDPECPSPPPVQVRKGMGTMNNPGGG